MMVLVKLMDPNYLPNLTLASASEIAHIHLPPRSPFLREKTNGMIIFFLIIQRDTPPSHSRELLEVSIGPLGVKENNAGNRSVCLSCHSRTHPPAHSLVNPRCDNTGGINTNFHTETISYLAMRATRARREGCNSWRVEREPVQISNKGCIYVYRTDRQASERHLGKRERNYLYNPLRRSHPFLNISHTHSRLNTLCLSTQHGLTYRDLPELKFCRSSLIDSCASTTGSIALSYGVVMNPFPGSNTQPALSLSRMQCDKSV